MLKVSIPTDARIDGTIAGRFVKYCPLQCDPMVWGFYYKAFNSSDDYVSGK
jgi:hypothetical protein